MKLTRRTAIRRAMLLSSGMLMGQMTLAKAQGTQLTVDLGQWSQVVFKYRGKSTAVPVGEIFEALKATE